MKIDPLNAARLFLFARGRKERREEDLIALTQLLEEFAIAGYNKVIDQLVGVQALLDEYGEKKIDVGYFSNDSVHQTVAKAKCSELYQEIIRRITFIRK